MPTLNMNSHLFQSWLEDKPQDEIVGLAGVSSKCPLARWYKEHISDPYITVSNHTIWIGNNQYELPKWANKFRERADMLHYGDDNLRAGECLLTLASIEL